MRLGKFDLNLLVALDVLIQERNVTRSARRLNVTQSAMSASLKRLREALGDPILVQHGKAMMPTPYALSLAKEVSDTLASLRRLIKPSESFDPAIATRVFRIAASDYIATVLLAPLLALLEREAPGIRLEISLPTDDTAGQLAKGDFDLVLTPEDFIELDHPADLLFEEAHVVVGCQHNPLLAGPLTVEGFASAGHVAVRIDGRNTYIDNELNRLGLSRRVEVHAPSFTQAPWLLPGTRRIALMHARLAQIMAPVLGLRIVSLPFEVPMMREMMQFHSGRRADDGLIWLRSKLRNLASA
ncbi:MAG TPA: LysR family transcriptional regulator [Croceibacterium sp.]|nr:LysR family transcriptional regulator [Croceibacterium sp.]